MKHVVTFILRVCVILLLSLFAYQRITGKTLDGAETRKKIDKIVLRVRNNIRTMQVHTGVTTNSFSKNSNNTISKNTTGDSTLLAIKEDLLRNNDFLANLKKASEDYRTSIGKGDIYAERVSSSDNRRDAVSVTLSGEKLRYPAKYNADNAFALDNNFVDRVYINSGIQLLYISGLHSVFYKAHLSGVGQRGIIQNIEQGTSIMMDGLTPLLYYKDRYLFTLQEYDKQKSLFVLNDRNELQTLGGRSIEHLAIDANVVAFQNVDEGLIYFLSLDNLKIIKTIPISTGSIFQGFVVKGPYVWIQIRNNITIKNLYQKRSRPL